MNNNNRKSRSRERPAISAAVLLQHQENALKDREREFVQSLLPSSR